MLLFISNVWIKQAFCLDGIENIKQLIIFRFALLDCRVANTLRDDGKK
jgi:hypothetical protein